MRSSMVWNCKAATRAVVAFVVVVLYDAEGRLHSPSSSSSHPSSSSSHPKSTSGGGNTGATAKLQLHHEGETTAPPSQPPKVVTIVTSSPHPTTTTAAPPPSTTTRGAPLTHPYLLTTPVAVTTHVVLTTHVALTTPVAHKLPPAPKRTAPTQSVQAKPPAQVGVPKKYDFQESIDKTCAGKSFTESDANCRGWSGLTEVECQRKCVSGEAAPNCPSKPCIAAVFRPGGQCDLYEPSQCKELKDAPAVHTFKKTDMSALQKVVNGMQKAVNSPVGKGVLEGAAVVAAVGAAAGGVAAAVASQHKPTTTTTTTSTPTTTSTTTTTIFIAVMAKEAGESSLGQGTIVLFFVGVLCCILTCCCYFIIKSKTPTNRGVDRDYSYEDEDEDEDYEDEYGVEGSPRE